MSSLTADPLATWMQFHSGAVVRVSKRIGGAIAGRIGVVLEKLDDAIDGYARYCVEVESESIDGMATRVDVSRCQLSRVKTGRGTKRRALSRSLRKRGAR